MPPMMASAAPPNRESPRSTVQYPATSDHAVMPMPRTEPTTMQAQGFASYRVCGVQERIALVYRRARAPRHLVTMTQYAVFAVLPASRPLRRVVPGALAHGDRAGRRIWAHARAHLRPGFLAPRAL